MEKRREQQWEAMIYRPIMPSRWKIFEQRGSTQFSTTTFASNQKKHHKADSTNLFVLFNEFNTKHPDNSNLNYLYSVRGGNDIKPNNEIKYFRNLKDAENYLIFLMDSTDRWIDEVNSQDTINAYSKRIRDIQSK